MTDRSADPPTRQIATRGHRVPEPSRQRTGRDRGDCATTPADVRGRQSLIAHIRPRWRAAPNDRQEASSLAVPPKVSTPHPDRRVQPCSLRKEDEQDDHPGDRGVCVARRVGIAHLSLIRSAPVRRDGEPSPVAPPRPKVDPWWCSSGPRGRREEGSWSGGPAYRAGGDPTTGLVRRNAVAVCRQRSHVGLTVCLMRLHRGTRHVPAPAPWRGRGQSRARMHRRW